MKKILCYFIMASSYRENIYRKMNDNLNCDFIIGEKIGDIKEMNLGLLSNLKLKPKRFYLFKNKLCYDKGVISFVLKNNYDVIIIGGDAYCITVWIVLLLNLLSKKKIIMWTHGYYGREKATIKFIKCIFFGMANKLLLYGKYARDLLVKNKIVPLNKLCIVYNSLNYEKQYELRSSINKTNIFKNNFSNNNPNIIFIGRLTTSKRLDLLIDSTYQLYSLKKDINLIFIGDGDARNYLVKYAELKNIKNVWFYGPCFEEAKLAELIYNADLCVSPGNVGLTAIHSMMFGTPVISHNDFKYQGPEFEAIIDEKTGSFFDYNDSNSLANSINKWLLANKDREQIRRNCFEVIDLKYNPNVQIEIMSDIINSI